MHPTLALLALVLLWAAPARARDNLLVVIADDLGVDGVGVYSRDDLYGHPGEGANPGPTPNIDQLAAEGILFRHVWAAPTCSPTRAAVLTGRHGFRTGIGVAGGQLGLEELTLPELLAAGHANAAIGKWHLGGNDADHPIDSGFDVFAGALGGALPDYESWVKVTNSAGGSEGTHVGYAAYATSDNVDDALARIAAFGEAPWFVWLAFNAPHVPYHVPPDALTTLAVDESSSNETMYRAAIEAMDTEIGRLLTGIPAGVLADTTIVFMGDNGTPGAVVQAPFIVDRAKDTLYEGGINVPLIVRSPWVAAADRGRESRALVSAVDLYATLAEIAGIESEAEDSVSLVPYLQDPDRATQAARPYVYAESFQPNGSGPYSDEQRAVRNETHKLIWRNGAYQELYDLEADPFEQTNLLLAVLGPEEQAAYDELVTAMESVAAGVGGAAAVPAVTPEAAGLLAALLALCALARLRQLA